MFSCCCFFLLFISFFFFFFFFNDTATTEIYTLSLHDALPISIYNSSAPDQVQYLVGHCGASVAILEDEGFLERFTEVRSSLPSLRDIVTIETGGGRPKGVLPWEELIAGVPLDLEAASKTAQPSDIATVIYTSGTTGPPKGVVLDHENICWTIECLRLSLGEDVAAEGRRLVSYLPMAHIAERMTSHYQGVAFGYEVSTCPE